MQLLFVFFFLFLFAVQPLSLHASQGVSIDGNLKYPPDFKSFAYTSDKAVKGGSLTLHDLGSFDKLNPFTLKGTSPLGLEMFVFEPLAVSSLDEPFSEYGLIAKNISVADDGLSVTFVLNENAKFSDGSPVTPEDVVYSFNTLKSDQAHPIFQYMYQDITKAEIVDPHTVRFSFSRRNRELHMIAAQLPVLSKAFYDKYGFNPESGKDAMVFPVGTGPYVVEAIDPGNSITYKRNEHYWAVNHPARKNMFNFDTITVKYFKDQTVSVEALKAGVFDFMLVNIAKQWVRDMTGPAFENGKLTKKLFPHKNDAGMQGFVFNTRRKIFHDPVVRKALGLALDFEWTNKTLFFDQYTRCNSYFSNTTDLAATGLPDQDELKLLTPFKDKLPPEVFTTPLTPPVTTPPSSLRGNLLKASKLLNQAGWTVQDGVRKNKNGEPFTFEIMLAEPSFERVMAPFTENLKKLGIDARYRTVDTALYEDRVKKFDFDMVVTVFGESQSPGNEQRSYWHSSTLNITGSRNLAGVSDPVVDHLVDAIIYAETRKELAAACRALDRVLWYGYYVIPNWYLNSHRIAYASRFAQPETLPLYYNPYDLLMTWWDGSIKQ